MESSEHNWANISKTICHEMLVLARRSLGYGSFQNILTNPIISQINTLLLPYFISYYSSAFTLNQFHNHAAEVYAPQRLVMSLNLCGNFGVPLNNFKPKFVTVLSLPVWPFCFCFFLLFRQQKACEIYFFSPLCPSEILLFSI